MNAKKSKPNEKNDVVQLKQQKRQQQKAAVTKQKNSQRNTLENFISLYINQEMCLDSTKCQHEFGKSQIVQTRSGDECSTTKQICLKCSELIVNKK